MATGELAEFGVGLFEHREDELVEIVPAGDDAVHVMLLILHGSEENWIPEIHHLRNASPGRAEELALGRSGALDLIVNGAKVFAEKLGFGREIHPLTVGREHAVLDVHAGIERE